MRLPMKTLMLLLLAAALAATGCERAQKTSRIAEVAAYTGADREQRLIEGAKKEGQVSVYSSLTVEDLTALAEDFEKKHGIKVNYWRASSEKVVQRFITESRGERHDADVIETNGPEMEALHREKLLQPLTSPYQQDLIPAAIQPHKEWAGTRLNLFVQIYNTQLVKKEELPKSFEDLRHPRWKGRLGIEAEDYDWFAGVVTGLGEDKGLKLFREIVDRNGMSVRKGHTLLAGLVASREVPYALTVYIHNAEKLKKKNAPVDWHIIPPAIARANGIAVSNRAPHPHAAILFYDYMLSEGQKILYKGQYVTTNKKIDSAMAKLPMKFVEPALILDESAKWQKLYEGIVTRPAK